VPPAKTNSLQPSASEWTASSTRRKPSSKFLAIPTAVFPPTLPTSVSGKSEPLSNANVRSARMTSLTNTRPAPRAGRHTLPSDGQSQNNPAAYLQPHYHAPYFSFILQLSIIHGYNMATMDIKSAYLNAPLPPDSDWIITTLEPHIAQACNLDPAQEYCIVNALYGLPDSGRIFYQHYRSALRAASTTVSSNEMTPPK